MLPSHHHISRYASERQKSAIAEAEHERRLVEATMPVATGTPPAAAPATSAPAVTQRLWLRPLLRLRRDDLAPLARQPQP